MLNKKLLEVILRLQDHEKSRLRLFICSPFFNNTVRSASLIRLYDLILEHNCDESHPSLQKESVFHLFFPKHRFQDKAKSPLDSLTTELFGLVKQFLVQLRFEKDHGEVYESLTMAKFYRKFAMEERFWQSLSQAKKAQEQSKDRTANFYLRQSQIEDEEYQFRGLYNSLEDDVNLISVLHNLDLYFTISRLEYTVALAHQKKVSRIEEETEDLLGQAIMSLSSIAKSLDVPATRLYRAVIDLLQNPDSEDCFFAFEKIALESEEIFQETEYKSIMAILRIFYGRRYLKSDLNKLNENIFLLYCQHLERGYLYFENMIPLTSMYNMVFYANKVQEYDWARNFLEMHPPERIYGTRYPKEIHSLCMAEYYFAIKDYAAAEGTLSYKLFENNFVSITADILLVKIYYETQNDLLENRMDALTKKIRRSNYTPAQKEQYLLFVKKLDKIIRITEKAKKQKLLEEIKNTQGVIAKDWLMSILGK